MTYPQRSGRTLRRNLRWQCLFVFEGRQALMRTLLFGLFLEALLWAAPVTAPPDDDGSGPAARRQARSRRGEASGGSSGGKGTDPIAGLAGDGRSPSAGSRTAGGVTAGSTANSTHASGSPPTPGTVVR